MKTYALLLPLLLLTACQDEQVLYKKKSPTPIDPVPGLAELASDPHANVRAPEAGNAAMPPPEPTEYRPMDLTEPLSTVELVGLEFPLPERYQRAEAPNEMRIAQWSVPARAGSGTGELVAFYFGPGQGGAAVENAMRWMRQFTPPEGKSTPLVSLTEGYPGKLLVTRVVMEGDYDPGQMSGGTATPQPGEVWRLDALVIEKGPEGTLFLRLTGPRELVEAEAGVMLHAAAMMTPLGDVVEDVASPAQPAVAADATATQRVGIPGVTVALPSHWNPESPSSNMRALQMRMGLTPEDPGEFVVFYFGPNGGGSAQDNVNRWIGQVQQGGSPKAPETAHVDVGPLHLDTVYVEGTYAPTAMGPMMPKPEPKEGYALFGAVVMGGAEGPLYIRATGPAEAMREARPALEAVLRSLEPAK